MLSVPIDISQLFVQVAGDFIFFLLVIALSQVAFILALSQRHRVPDSPLLKRYAFMSFGVVALWVIFLAGAIFARVINEDPTRILPPLDRFVLTLATLFLVGSFIVPERSTTPDNLKILLVILTLLITVAYVLTALEWWEIASLTDFNLIPLALAWLVIMLGLSISGIVVTLLTFNTITDAPIKMLFMALLTAGSAFSTYQTVNIGIIGNYDGVLRLTFLIALALVPVIVYRAIMRQIDAVLVQTSTSIIHTPASTSSTQTVPAIPHTPAPRTPAEGHSSQLLRALGLVLEARDASEIPTGIVKTSRDILHADLAALLRLQDANYADLTIIADSVNQRRTKGISLNLDNQPTLVNAIERHSLRTLYPDRNMDELSDLYTRMDVEKIGPVYFQPLISNQEVVAVLVVANPYTERELTKNEVELLKGIGIISSNLLAISYAAQESKRLAEDRIIQAIVEGVNPDHIDDATALASRQTMESNLNDAREEINTLNRQVMSLKVSLDNERTRIAKLLADSSEDLSISQELLAINEEQITLREERDALARRLQEAETALAGAIPTDSATVTQSQIERLTAERQSLKRERDNLQRQLDDLFARDRSLVPEMQKLVNSMLNERERLAQERDQLHHKLNILHEQLQTLGVEIDTDGAGLAQLVAQLTEERANLQTQLEKAQAERNALLQERSNIQNAIASEDVRDARLQRLEQEIENLASDREATTRQRDKLKAELQATRDKLEQVKQHRARLLAQVSGMELELSEIHDDQAQLRAQIQDLANKRPPIEPVMTPAEQNEVMMSLIQELRSPLTSIVGYLDLLMSESAGILGEMQRNFLQRVNVGVDRLKNMLEDLIQITQLDSGQRHFTSASINLIHLLEEAITDHSLHFRAKEIVLNMDLPDDLPLISADKDALTQIINQLLSNAYLVSPPTSEITVVTASYTLERAEQSIPSVHIAVTDSGGGIDSDDLPRIFARKYKADNPLISGLGDTGVGMAIAKALVDAHQGALWVTTQSGKGTTFHVAMPIQSQLT